MAPFSAYNMGKKHLSVESADNQTFIFRLKGKMNDRKNWKSV